MIGSIKTKRLKLFSNVLYGIYLGVVESMGADTERMILDIMQASGIACVEMIQSLWNDYGSIKRYTLEGNAAVATSVIVKHVCLPSEEQRDERDHPRGWNSDISHERKVRSYQVETNWYRDFSASCSVDSRVARCYGSYHQRDEYIIVLEDLDAAGYAARKQVASLEDAKACLRWLACFHAQFMQVSPDGLWEVGTYWHLETRPDELAALKDTALKASASQIDQILSSCEYLTLVHGDAKLANFCFGDDSRVAAVDFQYVGGGCGMKDVAYFIGSCFDESACEEYEERLLTYYFRELSRALTIFHPDINTQSIENEWRDLFSYAWADFHRFIKGWSPGHWKVNDYSERLTQQVLKKIAAQ